MRILAALLPSDYNYFYFNDLYLHYYFFVQPCPDGLDFRAVQCSTYNDQPYDGETVEWHPYYDEESPCTLMCVDSKGRVEEMSPRVRDGTRCRLGSLDMCIDGVCQVSESMHFYNFNSLGIFVIFQKTIISWNVKNPE